MIVRFLNPIAARMAPVERVRGAAESIGMSFEAHVDAQEMASLLYRDPDAMGVIWSPSVRHAIAVVKEWRYGGIDNPLFVLIMQSGANHTSFAAILNSGADDVQISDIQEIEIAARLDAIERRSRGQDAVIRIGACVYNPATGVLTSREGAVSLTRKEGAILDALYERRGFVLTKEQILDRLYDGRDEPELKIVDVFVCKIRGKFRRVSAAPVIETVWGRGYRLLSDAREAAE